MENFNWWQQVIDDIEYVQLVASLTQMGEVGKPYIKRLQSAERLAVGWLEHRISAELTVYPGLAEIGHAIIAEAFSSCTIQPGITTTDDVVWWMRQKVTNLGLETWFHPTIDVQRSKEALKSHIYSFSKGEKSTVILPGDLLHCDFGITYLGLNTDCQQQCVR